MTIVSILTRIFRTNSVVYVRKTFCWVFMKAFILKKIEKILLYLNDWFIMKKGEVVHNGLSSGKLRDKYLDMSIDSMILASRQNNEREVRRFILSKMELEDCTSLVQFGASLGLNLFLIEKNYPHFDFLEGYDLSQNFVDYGNLLAKRSGSKVCLKQMDVPCEISKLPSCSVDVVLSQGFLITQTVEEVENLIDNFFRIAKKRVILVERNDFTGRDIVFSDRYDINTLPLVDILSEKFGDRFLRMGIEYLRPMPLHFPLRDVNSIIILELSKKIDEVEVLPEGFFDR